jgi:putative phosphoesterase
MAKLLKKETALALRGERLRLVVVADTHSAPHPKTDELITALAPDHILHAGDIGDLAVIERLARIAPTLAVRGNIDVHAADLPDVLTIDVRDDTDSLFKILLLHIGVNGPRIRADAARLARAEAAKLVVCGHSHVPFLGRPPGPAGKPGDLSVFNPGSIGPRRFQLPIVFGVIDVTPQRVDLKHIDCETGQRWLP